MAENAALPLAGKSPARSLRTSLLFASALVPLLLWQTDAHAAAARSRRQAPVAKSATAPRQAPEDQADTGRIVLPAPAEGSYGISRNGDQLLIYPPAGTTLGDLSHLPRNVAAITAGDGQVAITAKPGTTFDVHYSGRRLMVDVVDARRPVRAAKVRAAKPAPTPLARRDIAAAPAVAAPVAATALPPPAPATPLQTAAAIPAVAPPAAVPRAIPAPAAAPVIAPPVIDAAPRPGSVAIEPAGSTAAAAIVLPASRDVGAAAFRSGPDLVLVLDAPIDYQPPGARLDPAFQQLTSRQTQDATVIRLPAPGNAVRLDRVARGWQLTLAAPAAPLAGMLPRLIHTPGAAAYIRMAAAQPSRTVIVVDPQTGGRLLVGTQMAAGEAVLAERRDVQFTMMATLQGVVVAPSSDDLRLTPIPDAFLLIAGPHAGDGIISGADTQDATTASAAPTSQMLDLPTDATPVLAQRLTDQIREAANTPTLARTPARLRVAQTMLALGLGPEAEAVIDVAAADDPASHDTPRAMALHGVAAVLAGRLDEAAALADPRLNGTGEIELWRALLHVARNQATPQDAHSLRAALPLVLGYAAPLRQRVLPVALETMALNGEAAAALATLQSLPDDHTLDLARGMALEASGQAPDALQAYDKVASRGDRLARYTAMVRAVELRMKSGQLDARAGADALDRELFGWRGEDQELPLRLRIAGLRRDAGQWNEALGVLRDGREALPDDRAAIDQELAATFLALFTGDAAQAMPANEFVKLYDRNADLVQTIAWPEAAGMKLVDRLVGLGLLARAEPVMAKLVGQNGDPLRRPMLGAQLASLRLALDDPAAATAALADTTAPAGATIPPDVVAARQLLYARAEANRGNTDRALAMLTSLSTPEADGLRADLYTARKDWPHAVAALAALEQKQIPSPATLTDAQQALVLREAEAATLASDGNTLARLAGTYGAAMAGGTSAAMFQLVTSTPVTGSADLPRAFTEVDLARKLPDTMAPPIK